MKPKPMYEEITQLEIAYHALKTQPRDAQVRMLAWLESKLYEDCGSPLSLKTVRHGKKKI